MANQSGADPDRAIVIIDEVGDIYLLASDVWQKAAEKITDPGRALLPNQVRQSGGLISFVGRDLVGPGIGAECTIVNLQAILKNVLSGQGAQPALGATSAGAPALAAPNPGPSTGLASASTAQRSGTGMTPGDAAGNPTKGG